MALVSSNFEHFHFLAFFSPVRLLDPILDHQCIQRNNTLEVKTPGLIVDIVIPLTYISKVCYITSRCCKWGNNP
jgi:hypothetical protein